MSQIIDFKKIKRAADATGMSVRAIAEKTGSVTHSSVHSLINGKTSPLAETLKSVCDVIGVPIEEAFVETEERMAA